MAKAKAEKADGGLNKREMVEAAMNALGDAGPKELQEYVKQHYGEEMKYGHVASYKSQITKKRGGGSGRKVGASGGSGVDVQDVAVVKGLVDRLGTAKLQELIKVLG